MCIHLQLEYAEENVQVNINEYIGVYQTGREKKE